MKFSDYKNERSKKSDKQNNFSGEYSTDMLQGFLRGYEGKSKSDIVSEIVKVAEKNRREGKLTDKDLDDFAMLLTPSLNSAQKKELDAIISRLKTQ